MLHSLKLNIYQLNFLKSISMVYSINLEYLAMVSLLLAQLLVTILVAQNNQVVMGTVL